MELTWEMMQTAKDLILSGYMDDLEDAKRELMTEYDWSEEEADEIIKTAEEMADRIAGHY